MSKPFCESIRWLNPSFERREIFLKINKMVKRESREPVLDKLPPEQLTKLTPLKKRPLKNKMYMKCKTLFRISSKK